MKEPKFFLGGRDCTPRAPYAYVQPFFFLCWGVAFLYQTGKKIEFELLLPQLLRHLKIKHFSFCSKRIKTSKFSIGYEKRNLTFETEVCKVANNPCGWLNFWMKQGSNVTKIPFRALNILWLWPWRRPNAWHQGTVSRKSRELFGPEKLVVKLQSVCFEKPKS